MTENTAVSPPVGNPLAATPQLPIPPGETAETKARAQPESISDLLRTMGQNAGPLAAMVTAIMDRLTTAQAARSRFTFWMTIVAGVVILAIVGVAAGLTYCGKIDGSTFTFLLGLVVGYTLTFIRDSIRPPASQ